MTFEYYELNFRKKALLSGYSEENIQKCLKYAKPLIEQELPVIYNTANLAALVGYKKNYLKKAALFTTYFYREFSIKKYKGGVRILKEPLPSLKEIQFWILENILYKISVSKYAKAYIPHRNLLDNAKYHKNKTVVLGLDITDFFSSINRESIEDIFLSLHYSSNISNLLSKLCCCDDILPQGAPTSPYLSNLYMRNFDEVVSSYCKENSIKYSRYADDLTFSGDFDTDQIIAFVKQKLSEINLFLNDNKTNVMRKNTRQIVTGIVTNEKLQIPKYKRDQIRQEIYYIKKLGLQQHLLNTKNSRNNYLYHLIGKINFALHINPEDKNMKAYYEFIKSKLPSNSDEEQMKP